jgi:hypothetical protein
VRSWRFVPIFPIPAVAPRLIPTATAVAFPDISNVSETTVDRTQNRISMEKT